VPDRGQPHLRNPEQDFIINADNKIAPEGYPYLITKYYATPDRFIRDQEMLTEKKQLEKWDLIYPVRTGSMA
jgi:penicillin amidase